MHNRREFRIRPLPVNAYSRCEFVLAADPPLALGETRPAPGGGDPGTRPAAGPPRSKPPISRPFRFRLERRLAGF